MYLWVFLAVLIFPTSLHSAQLDRRPKALVVDWEMNPAVVLSSLFRRIEKAGYVPFYRPYYPRITAMDLREASLVVLLSGPSPGGPGYGMSAGEVDPLVRFAKKGGILVLGPVSGSPHDLIGDNERYLFNLILHRLGTPIRIMDDWVTDEENCFYAPLWTSPLVTVLHGHPAAEKVQGRLIFDRTPSLLVSEPARTIVSSHPTSYPRHDPQDKAPRSLVAEANCGEGKVLVASRYVLTYGGGNSKEPSSPMLPRPEEEGLSLLLDFIFQNLNQKIPQEGSFAVTIPYPEEPLFPLPVEPPADVPPSGIKEITGYDPPGSSPLSPLAESHRWILEEGVRAGWAHMDKEEGELQRLANGMGTSGMNVFWGVGHPQVLLGAWGSEEQRVRLIESWNILAPLLAQARVRWLLGVNFPGGPSTRTLPGYAVGAEGSTWTAPSPWDKTLWEREIIPSLRVAAHWSRSHPAMCGVVLDLEMYGRMPLFFGNGVDFGEAPFKAFLERMEVEKDSPLWKLGPGERFPWLRDVGLLERYYSLLEWKAEELGRRLRREVRSIRPDWVLGCYTAGVLHRWFYRGLMRGLGEAGKPVLLFTFQRDVTFDLSELKAQGIEVVHVRGLLMGMMSKDDYRPLFQDSFKAHAGYWLNRLTSLVAKRGFLPIEAPRDMGQEEAWRMIGEANRGLQKDVKGRSGQR